VIDNVIPRSASVAKPFDIEQQVDNSIREERAGSPPGSCERWAAIAASFRFRAAVMSTL
jgi:hypothetical protein